jgi:hypothetical protein
MIPTMTYDQAIAHFGDYKALADALGLPYTTVHSWRSRGIPEGRQYQIQVVSRGKVKVGDATTGDRTLAL